MKINELNVVDERYKDVYNFRVMKYLSKRLNGRANEKERRVKISNDSNTRVARKTLFSRDDILLITMKGFPGTSV